MSGAPPPNNPSNPPSHQRKAASYGRGWFDGIGVISGMAPRPMTPQPERRHQRSNSISSAPNSPARSFAGFSIQRLPSQDSLDRSIHNESGHGKSTAQIIKDLKKANSELTNRTATMEANFMNKLANETRPLEEKLHLQQEQAKKQNKHLAQMEAYKVAADSKLLQMQEQLQKTKEESAFQRHTISDLKSQVHQLQGELDDSLDDREDWELVKRENERLKQELAQAKESLEQHQSAQISNAADSPEGAADSPEGAADQDYYQELQASRMELKTHQKRLTATQSSLERAQLELAQQESAEGRAQELEQKLEQSEERWSMREQDLQSQLLEQQGDGSDWIAQIQERDEIIASLEEKLEDYVAETTNLAATLAEFKEASLNQEQYRRDEAEDLRILHDAQEEGITNLRTELERAQNELALLSEEMNDNSNSKEEEIQKLQRELDDSQRMLQESPLPPLAPSKEYDPELLVELQEQLEKNREKVGQLETSIKEERQNREELELQLEKAEEAESALHEEIGRLQQQQELFPKEEKKTEDGNSDHLEIQRLEELLTASKGELNDAQEQFKEAQVALVALDDEKEELIKKHAEILESMDQESREWKKRLATKDDELFAAIEQLADRQELEMARDTLQTQVDTLEEQLASNSSSEYFDSVKEQREELKLKLEDRDTTIAALVRSSMSVEEKIADLEQKIADLECEKDQLQEDSEREVATLKNSMDSWQLEKEKLENEIIALEKDLTISQTDSKRWQQALRQQPNGDARYHVAAMQKSIAEVSDKMQERDNAIDNLVSTNMDLEMRNKDLKARIISLVKEVETAQRRNKYDSPELRSEIDRLQAENDMFAGQIIEQDEELQNLVREIKLRDQNVMELREIAQATSDRPSNREDQEEIRALGQELSGIQAELQERSHHLMQCKQELSNLRQQHQFGGDDPDMMAADLTELQKVNEDYRVQLRGLRTELWEANQAASAAHDLKLELAQAQYAFDEYKRKQQEVDKDGIIKQLGEELEGTKVQNQKVQNLEEQLQILKSDRTLNEITLLESFERRTKEKDAVIETLKSDLETARGKPSHDFSELTTRLEELESENVGMEEQFGVELQSKNQQIYALEQTLHAQEQLIVNMRQEMDQLQHGMEYAAERRRGDFEDLQQEMLFMESKATKQEREIANLKMQLEECKLEHRAEVSKLKDIMVQREEQPHAKTLADLQNDERMLEVKERLENLKKRNMILQEENIKLGGRFERATIEIKSFSTERKQMSELELDNRKLRNQLKEMDTILQSQRKQRPPVAPSPSPDKENPLSKPKKLSKTSSFGGLFKNKKKKNKAAAAAPSPQPTEEEIFSLDYDDEDDILQSSF